MTSKTERSVQKKFIVQYYLRKNIQKTEKIILLILHTFIKYREKQNKLGFHYSSSFEASLTIIYS